VCSLVDGLDAAGRLVGEFRIFNQDKYQLHYPEQDESGPLRSRASETARPSQLTRSHTLPDLLPLRPLSALSIGPFPTALDHAAKANMLGEQFGKSLAQLANLRTRIISSTSRILVTGDLNAGKSSVVNALLRQDGLVPVDQQPCTGAFCEICDADRENGGKVEVHAVLDGKVEAYEKREPGSFEIHPLEALAKLVCPREEHAAADEDLDLYSSVDEIEPPKSAYALIKAYVKASPDEAHEADETFLHNSHTPHSLSVIDSPGLNISNVHTTSLFARQTEIDIVVFVVSAENHFTLSAEEFLRSASLEKPYIFIVVNKWSAIRDKRFAARRIGEQIRRLSPATYKGRDELVHFVDAEAVLAHSPDASFDHLESSLRSFVLLKRAQSKLSPAKNFLSKTHHDLMLLSEYNLEQVRSEREGYASRLDVVLPENERLIHISTEVQEAIAETIESHVDSVKGESWKRIETCSRHVSNGQVPPTSTISLPEFSTLLDIFSWADAVRDALLGSIEADVRAAEDEARMTTLRGVNTISTDLSRRFLPQDAPSLRQFFPEKMFRRNRFTIATLDGVDEIGFELTDLVDLERIPGLFHRHVGSSTGFGAAGGEDSKEVGGGVVSLGAGGILALYAGKTWGIKSMLDTVARVVDVLGSKAARKWAGPVAAVIGSS
jgi:mitofusin